MGRKGLTLFARQPHYLDHLLPIWEALDLDLKNRPPMRRFDTLLIGGGPDVRYNHPYVYVEHGAGQSYVGTQHSSYSGGRGHDCSLLFICPNQSVADRWSMSYPDTPTAVVGCPKLDPWHDRKRGPREDGKTVAITFHWNCKVAPETLSAFPHYRDGLRDVVRSYHHQGWTVIGHSHPRYVTTLQPFWTKLGIEWVEHGSEVLDRANVLVADNTSLMAEFLSCGRPVVALNAPWYRRDVHHGMRFWEWDVTYADTAVEASQIELDDLKTPVHHPYAYNDGRAAQRAAEAISDLMR